MPTQLEYNVTKQKFREIYAKIYLLGTSEQIVDELSGVVIGEPSFSVDADSDIRRTLNISLYPKDSSFDVKKGNKIWLDKAIDVRLGIKDIQTGEITWTRMGIYMVNNPTRIYSSTDNTITLDCVDLMANLNGIRNGQLEYSPYVIKQGENIASVIENVYRNYGFFLFAKSDISECMVYSDTEGKNIILNTPNEIRVGGNSTAYDILKELRDIMPNYQMYFDIDGTFRYNLIPNGTDETAMIDDDIWEKCLIDYNVFNDFSEVSNSVIVYGGVCNDFIYIEKYTIVGDVCNLILPFPVEQLLTGQRLLLNLSFPTGQETVIKTISIGTKEYPLRDIYKNNYAFFKNGEGYIIEYNFDFFLFMGKIIPMAVLHETNPDSPFYVDDYNTPIIRKVFQGGEYNNIHIDALAMERAKFELYTHCRLQDTVTLTCIPIYWLDVNWVIELTLPNKQGITETNKYIIKKINTSGGINGTQTITLMRYYPFYPPI